MTKTKTKKEEVKVNEEAAILKSQLARTLADYDNLVKRVERDRETIEKVVSLRLILKLLSVLDGLEMAQEHIKDAGLAISIGEFINVLKDEGLTVINPKIGDHFNENEMEAVEAVDGGLDSTVAEVVLTGWKYSDDSVIRHSKVKVYKNEAKKPLDK